jgi:hypothetical protein
MKSGKKWIWNSCKGLLAGYAALKVMEPITEILYKNEDPAAKKREDDARGGKAAYDAAAEKISNALHLELGGKGLKIRYCSIFVG